MSEIVSREDRKGVVVVVGGMHTGLHAAMLREAIAEVADKIKDEIQVVEEGLTYAEDWMFFETKEDKRVVTWLEDNVRRGKSVVIVGEERSGKVHLLKKLLKQRERTARGFTLVEDITEDSLQEMKEELEEQRLIIGKHADFLGTIDSRNVNAALSNMWWTCTGEKHDTSYSNLLMETIDIVVLVHKGEIVGVFTTEPYGETGWMVKEIPGMPNTVDVFEHPKQDPKVMEMLKLVVEQRKSVVIVGEGTAKIGLLHKLFTFIPPKDRLTIWAEDIVFSAFNQLDYIPDFDEFRMPDNRYDMREKVLNFSQKLGQRVIFGGLNEVTTSAAVLTWSMNVGRNKGIALLDGFMSGAKALTRIDELSGHTAEGLSLNNRLTYALDYIVVMDGERIVEVSEVIPTSSEGELKVNKWYELKK